MTLHEVNDTSSITFIWMKLLQIKQHLSTSRWLLSSFQNGKLHLLKVTVYHQEVLGRPFTVRFS